MAKPRKQYAKKATTYVETDVGKVATGVKFTFTHGPVVELMMNELPPAIRAEAEAHGLRQKIGDSWNKAESAREAYTTCLAMIDRLANGDWRAEGGGGFGISDDWILKAVAELKEKNLDEVQVTWDSLSDEAKDRVRKDATTKATAERIRAEAKVANAPAADVDEDPLAAF